MLSLLLRQSSMVTTVIGYPAHSERSLAAAAKYYELAQAKGLSLAQLALAWCKSRWYVASTM